jgi:arginine/ornithine transport system substrate-binding protein
MPSPRTLSCHPNRPSTRWFAAAALVFASLVPGLAVARDWTTVRIGIDPTYKPFTYKTPDGQPAGFDIDIANALCAEMKVKCTFVESSWEGIIPGLRANKFDAIISSMSITEERSKVVDFTDKYYSSPTYVIAKAGSIDGSAASLKGKRVGALKASVQETYAKGVFVPAGANVVSYDSTQQAYVDLKSGRLDAVIADKLEAQGGFLDTPDGRGFAFVGPALNDPKYFGKGAGIAVRKTDAELRDRFNAALKTIRASGAWKKAADKYFTFDVYDDK